MMNLDKTFTCPVCLDILRSPIILQCSHNLCMECAGLLITQLKSSQEQPYFSCPCCRSKTQLHSISIDSLPRNKILEHLIYEWQLSQFCSECFTCQDCIESPSAASFECITCEAFFCQPCAAGHNSTNRFAHHKLAPLGKTRAIVCLQHFQELSLFCCDEKVLICKLCIGKHQGHQILTISQASQFLKSDALGQRLSLKEAWSNLETEIAKLVASFEMVQSAEKKCLTELDGLFNRIAEDMQSFKAATQQKINENYAGVKLQIKNKISAFEMSERQIERTGKLHDELEFLQVCTGLLPAEKLNFDVKLPNLLYSCCTLPVLSISNPSKHLYYLNRGTREFYTYNLENSQLSVKELPNNVPHISKWSAYTTVADGRILVTGGKTERNQGSNRTSMYIDPYKLLYYPGASMLRGHSSHLSIRVLNKVFIISGKNEENTCDSFCEVLDGCSESWSQIESINFPRTCAAGCYINEFIYVLGGFQSAISNSIERYSTILNHWTVLPTVLPEKIWQHGCFPLDNKRILIFGGEKDSEEPNKASYIYDTIQEDFGSYTLLDSIPVFLYFWIQVIRHGSFLLAINKEKSLVKYSIVENKWSLTDLA